MVSLSSIIKVHLNGTPKFAVHTALVRYGMGDFFVSPCIYKTS